MGRSYRPGSQQPLALRSISSLSEPPHTFGTREKKHDSRYSFRFVRPDFDDAR